MELVVNTLLSAPVLFFILGVIAALGRSDLQLPNGLKETLSIYLLIAIGMKGGIELAHYSFADIWKPLALTLALGVTIPLVIYAALKWTKLSQEDKIALVACYGSVSIVTYGAAVGMLESQGIPFDSYMNAMVVVLESPAILLAMFLYRSNDGAMREVVRESFLGKSSVLLVGSLLIGYATSAKSAVVLKPFLYDAYQGVLVLFLLGMGLTAGERLREVWQKGMGVMALGIAIPITAGLLSFYAASFIGLSPGNAVLMAILGGSASYIAAPAALQASVPKANPSFYLGMALGITFPFNLMIGIPLYMSLV